MRRSASLKEPYGTTRLRPQNGLRADQERECPEGQAE
jgi:hypothetical protein